MTNQTIHVVASVIALPDKVEALKAVLLEIIKITRQEPGVIKYELFQNHDDPTDFTFLEEWASNEALNNHQNSPHIQEVAARLEGLVVGTPNVRYYYLVA